MILILYLLGKTIQRVLHAAGDNWVMIWGAGAGLAIIVAMGTAAGISRIFLVVEAFISVRKLPLGAYSSVNWTGLLPHIGS
jgi:hypothetical protein